MSTKYKPNQIFDELKKGNIDDAVKMYNTSVSYVDNYLPYLIINDSIELFDIAIKHNLMQITRSLCDDCAGMNLIVLKHCLSMTPNNENMLSTQAPINAAKHGLIDVLDYIKSIKCEFNWGVSIVAIEYDKLDVFKWLEENISDKVYYRYSFRTNKCNTFEVPKYLYSKGYQPSYYDYKKALQNEEMDYIKWLIEIKCKGTFDIIEEPKDIIGAINNLCPCDFCWLQKIIQEERLPEMKFDWHVSPAFIKYLPQIVTYLKEHNVDYKYLLQYVVRNYNNIVELFLKFVNNYVDTKEILNADAEEILIYFVNIMSPNKKEAAYMYMSCHNDYKLVAELLLTKTSWNYIFLDEINGWINKEGSYQPIEFVHLINELWKKYEDKVDCLQDKKNKTKWKKLIKNDPQKCDMHEFLQKIMKW